MPRLRSLPGNFDDFLAVRQDLGSPNRTSHALRVVGFCYVVAAGGVFFNPYLAYIVGVGCAATYARRFNRVVDGLSAGSGSGATPSCDGDTHLYLGDFWVHGVIAVVMVAQHERTALKQFLLECAIQRAAAQRIDQLGNEKERLDYELRMEEVKLENAERQLASAQSNGQGSSSHSDEQPPLQMSGAGAGIQLTSRDPAAGGVALTQPRACVAGAGRRACGSPPGSTAASSYTCDELTAIAEGAGWEPPEQQPQQQQPTTQHAELAAEASTPAATAGTSSSSSPSSGTLLQCSGAGAREPWFMQSTRSLDQCSAGSVPPAAVSPAPQAAAPMITPETHGSGRGSSPGSGGESSSQVVVPLAVVRVESQLNWPERQRLNSMRSLQRPPSKSDGGSDSASSWHNNTAGPTGSAGGSRDHATRMGQTCPRRETALWRTLRRSGLISSPEPASSTASHASEYFDPASNTWIGDGPSSQAPSRCGAMAGTVPATGLLG